MLCLFKMYSDDALNGRVMGKVTTLRTTKVKLPWEVNKMLFKYGTALVADSAKANVRV